MSDGIQFEKAQYASGSHCVQCQNPLQGSYFRLNNATVCPNCAEKARLDHLLQQSQSGGLLRALLFGLGAAIAGAVIYGAIAVLTGYEFALIAIFIGWMVGKAMMRGSRGTGGRRLQMAAVVLTYLSITAGYVPSIVKELMNAPITKVDSASMAGDAASPAATPASKVSPAVAE